MHFGCVFFCKSRADATLSPLFQITVIISRSNSPKILSNNNTQAAMVEFQP